MRRLFVVSLFTGSIILFSGCATIISGRDQRLPVTSDPSGAEVATDTGLLITTPGELRLRRNENHTLTATHEEYKPQQVRLYNQRQWGLMLLSGIVTRGVGRLVDGLSGASQELVPKKVHFDFEHPEKTTTENAKLAVHWTKKEVKAAMKARRKAEKEVKAVSKKMAQAEKNAEKAEKKAQRNRTAKTQQDLEKARKQVEDTKKREQEAGQRLEEAEKKAAEIQEILTQKKEILEAKKTQGTGKG